MITVDFHNDIDDILLKFAVICAKIDGKWIFCRHKKCDTWELLGGHREENEDINDTAKRELFEETGATDFNIYPVVIYSVTDYKATTYGKLFFADVRSLSTLPDLEIGEIAISEVVPKSLTYPDIQPILFKKVQDWLNLQSSADEIWDIYDENRNLTGRTHRRGDPLPKGDYHLSVHVWLQNSDGKFLMTKRTPNKGFPNMWECTGGSAITGDNSLTAAMREVKEETGLTVNASNGKCVISYKRDDNFCDVWLFKQDFNLNDVVLLENETCDAIYATKEEILKMKSDGILVPFRYLDELFSII